MQLMLNISGKKVNGALMLGGSELIGSGEITGHIHGKSITFQSPGDGTTFTQITWMGTHLRQCYRRLLQGRTDFGSKFDWYSSAKWPIQGIKITIFIIS